MKYLKCGYSPKNDSVDSYMAIQKKEGDRICNKD
jgi:hypothetical protein